MADTREVAQRIIDQFNAGMTELLSTLPSAPAPPPTGTVVIKVPRGSDLQKAWDAAIPGTMLLIDPRDAFGGLRITPKSVQSTTPIVLKADTANLEIGKRLDPSAYADCFKIKSVDPFVPALMFEPGSHPVTFDGFAPLPGFDGTPIIRVGDGREADPLRQPDGVMFNHLLLQADPLVGHKRGLEANGLTMIVRDGYISDFWREGQDSQGIGGWNGPGPTTIENTYVEASGENILFGGTDAGSPRMLPTKLILRRCHLTKPVAWRLTSKGSVKNTFELKSMFSAVIESNIIENSWQDAQTGFLILLTPRNQDGTVPQSGLLDITVRFNVLRHCAGLFQISGEDDINTSARTNNISIHNNLAYDIDPSKWKNEPTGQWGAGRVFQVTHGPKNVHIHNNTIDGINLQAFLTIGTRGMMAEGLSILNNLLPEGEYGLKGDDKAPGLESLDTYAPGAVFKDNLISRTQTERPWINYGPDNEIAPRANVPAIQDLLNTRPMKGSRVIGADIAEIKRRIPNLTI